MRKTDLQQQAIALIGQLSTEKLKVVLDYLDHLQDKDARNNLPDQDIPPRGLGTAVHAIFKPFGGVELEIPSRESPRFET
jgi:hypothetical protein